MLDDLESNVLCSKVMVNGELNVFSIFEIVVCEICFCEYYLDSFYGKNDIFIICYYLIVVKLIFYLCIFKMFMK